MSNESKVSACCGASVWKVGGNLNRILEAYEFRCSKCLQPCNLTEGSVSSDDSTSDQSPKPSFSDLISEPETPTEAIQRGYDNANDAWKAKALDTLHSICLKNRLICADDLVEAMEDAEETTHTLNAISGVFKQGIKNGWIEHARCSCGQECMTTESRRKGNNSRRIQVYQSML